MALPFIFTISLVPTSTPYSVTILPFNSTFPHFINLSASLREHTPHEEIYLFIKPNGNDRLMKASIKDICNPVGDSLRQKLSKINRIIKSVVLNPQLADSYTINGDRGQKYNIEIAPDLRIFPNWLIDRSLFDI